jgi:hypothetical protein
LSVTPAVVLSISVQYIFFSFCAFAIILHVVRSPCSVIPSILIYFCIRQ